MKTETENSELRELFKETYEELKNIGIPVSENIEKVTVNKRAEKRLGRCIRQIKREKEIFTVEISEVVLKSELKEIKEVIAHELIHTCRGCMNHGGQWKAYADKANRAYGYSISRLKKITDNEKEKYKYAVKCMNCGAVIERKRMCPLIKNPRNYRCGKCGGKLKICEKSTTSCR